MKNTAFAFLILFLLPFLSGAQSGVLKNNTKAFGPSEVLEYRVHYGFIDAGTAKLEVDPVVKNLGGRSCYRVVGTGRSVGAFDWFFKVRDHYESYIDSESLLPHLFIRKIEEGGYKKNQNVSFNHSKATATSEKKTIRTPGHVQDIISAFYYARTLDFERAAVGDTFMIQCYLDDETFPMVIKYTGKQTIKTKVGTFRCIVFKPYLLEGRVFKEKEGMTVWVTDDKNKIPVRAQAEILVGSVKMDITSYKGLQNPLALVSKK
jgi:hypothetical protein